VGSKRAVVVIVGLALAAGACSSSSKAAPSPVSVTTSTVVRGTGSAAALTFREVLGQEPYGTTAKSSATCHGGRDVTPSAGRIPTALVVLADSTDTACYELGPVLLTGQHVSAVGVDVNQTTASWEIDVQFDNDDFVTKVAGPYVNKQIAILVNGVLESAPNLEPGITGRDVTISANFSEAAARRVAAAIAPTGTIVKVTPAPPPITASDNVFTRRCASLGRRLPHDQGGGGSALPVAVARSAFVRAKEPIPAEVANASQPFALCYFIPAPVTPLSRPTCPNGQILITRQSLIGYAVDADLNAIRLPPIQYLFPAGITVPTDPNSCLQTP
jgi:hypothetical protein